MIFSRLSVVISVAAALSFAFSALPAMADVGGRAVTLEPDPQTSSGGVGTAGAVSPGASYRCTESGTLRNQPNAYAIGWCNAPNMHIDISSLSEDGNQAGYGEGAYQHCGWFLTAIHPLVPEGTYDHGCGGTKYPEVHFANKINSTPSNDGDSVVIFHSCTRYLNVQPWSSSATSGSTAVGTLLASDQFFWRYRTRNTLWVMGRMARRGTSIYYDWAFVPSSCVSTPVFTRNPKTTL